VSAGDRQEQHGEVPAAADQALSRRPRVPQGHVGELDEARQHVLGVPRVDLGYPVAGDAVLGEIAVGPVVEDQLAGCGAHRGQRPRHRGDPVGKPSRVGDGALRRVERVVGHTADASDGSGQIMKTPTRSPPR
jgi:hypothetical protein